MKKKNLERNQKILKLSIRLSLMGVGCTYTSCLHQCSFFELKVHYYTFDKKYTRLILYNLLYTNLVKVYSILL